MIPIIPTPPGGTEIVLKRTLRAKHFDMGGLKRQAVAGLTVAHVPDDVAAWEAGGSFAWLDVDTDLEFVGGVYRPKQAWHTSEVDPLKLAYTFISKRRGNVEITLKKINDVALQNMALSLNPEPEENKLWFRDFTQTNGLDIYFEFGPARMRVYKILKNASPGIPLKFEWEVSRAADEDVNIREEQPGSDNIDEMAPGRENEKKSRPAEILHTRTPDETVTRPGRTTFVRTEKFTGRTVRVDPVTRVPGLVNNHAFPVRM